jgi:enoyl-CoA hydratase
VATTFEVSTHGAVAHLRLVRPDELNTMIPDFWRDFPRAVTELSRSGTARALVISSTGRHFSAGMELSVFAEQGREVSGLEAGRQRARMRESVASLQAAFSCLEQARMPVLVAVQGGCIGGAVDLACAADLRYASADAFFCVQEINIGITADLGTLQRLGRIVGEGAAREMAFTGRRVAAVRAYELGLVQGVFGDHEELVAGALEIAAEIAAKSPLAVHGTKVALTYARDHPVADALDQIAGWQAGMFQPADLLEALAARTEGRPPVFPDLAPEATGL